MSTGMGMLELRPRERRTEQVNVRLAPSERRRLEQQARALHFRSVGELVRAALVATLPAVGSDEMESSIHE